MVSSSARGPGAEPGATEVRGDLHVAEQHHHQGVRDGLGRMAADRGAELRPLPGNG